VSTRGNHEDQSSGWFEIYVKDFASTTGAETSQDFVRPEFVADGERHVLDSA
jgi:hypothetical protein